MDAAAFDAWYESRYDALVGQVFVMCGSRAAASDAVQEAFTEAWARRSQVGGYEHRDAWIRTVARRRVVSDWRRSRRVGPLTAEPVTSDADPTTLVALQRALADLPDNHRHAVVLHYLVDLPVAAIAAELGAKEGTVRVWLSRGRARLEQLLSDTEEVHHA